jgi:hypothetical protein
MFYYVGIVNTDLKKYKFYKNDSNEITLSTIYLFS